MKKIALALLIVAATANAAESIQVAQVDARITGQYYTNPTYQQDNGQWSASPYTVQRYYNYLDQQNQQEQQLEEEQTVERQNQQVQHEGVTGFDGMQTNPVTGVLRTR